MTKCGAGGVVLRVVCGWGAGEGSLLCAGVAKWGYSDPEVEWDCGAKCAVGAGSTAGMRAVAVVVLCVYQCVGG